MSLLSRAGFKLVGRSKAGKATYRGPGTTKPVSETTARRLAKGGSKTAKPRRGLRKVARTDPRVQSNFRLRVAAFTKKRREIASEQVAFAKRIGKLERKITSMSRRGKLKARKRQSLERKISSIRTKKDRVDRQIAVLDKHLAALGRVVQRS